MTDYIFKGKNGAVGFVADLLGNCCGISEVSIHTIDSKTSEEELHKEFLLALTGDQSTSFIDNDGGGRDTEIPKMDEGELRVRMFILTDVEEGKITKFCGDCGLVPTSVTVNPKTDNTISIWLIESAW